MFVTQIQPKQEKNVETRGEKKEMRKKTTKGRGGRKGGNLSDYRGSRAQRERAANPETDASRFNRLAV